MDATFLHRQETDLFYLQFKVTHRSNEQIAHKVMPFAAVSHLFQVLYYFAS